MTVTKQMKPEDYCRLRKIAYGLFGCHNCPISCTVRENNLNELANIESDMIQEQDKPCLMSA